MERRTRKTFVDRQGDEDDWSFFDDEDDEGQVAPLPLAPSAGARVRTPLPAACRTRSPHAFTAPQRPRPSHRRPRLPHPRQHSRLSHRRLPSFAARAVTPVPTAARRLPHAFAAPQCHLPVAPPPAPSAALAPSAAPAPPSRRPRHLPRLSRPRRRPRLSPSAACAASSRRPRLFRQPKCALVTRPTHTCRRISFPSPPFLSRAGRAAAHRPEYREKGQTP